MAIPEDVSGIPQYEICAGKYGCARTYLVVEMFVSLRSVLEDWDKSFQWFGFFPHIG